jgi:nucleoside phosphorylase
MYPKNRDQFEIAIICALPLEADSVLALFDEFYDITDWQPLEAANSYTIGRIGRHHVVLSHMPDMGKVGAAGVASRLSTNFVGIKLALVVGICGGVPFTAGKAEIILGDVIISHNIVEYDSGKQYPDGFRKKPGARDTLPQPSQDIRSFLSKLKTRRIHNQIQEQMHGHLQYFKDPFRKESRYPGTSHDVLFEASYLHKHHSTGISLQCSCETDADPVCHNALTSDCSILRCAGELIERDRLGAEYPRPFIHFGTMASADTVMKSGEHRDKMAELDGIIGFEMEGAGVWAYIPCIIIKGVCDYADSHKSKVWQNYAASTAACCTKAFLESYQPTTRECE